MFTKILIWSEDKEELLTRLDVLKEQIHALTEEQFEQHVISLESASSQGTYEADIYTDDDIDASTIDDQEYNKKLLGLLEEVSKYMDSKLNDVLNVWYTDPPILLTQIKEALGK